MSWAKLAIVLLVAGLPLGGPAHRRTEAGNALYDEGRYDEALQAYTEAQLHDPEAPELFYDIGNVLYRQGDFVGAEEAYTRGLASADGTLAPRAAYNLGNAFFKQELYDRAADEYRRALRLDPGDRDAKRNLELALRKLEEQQQQQQQDKPDDPQQQDEDEQEQEQDQQQQDQGEREPEQQQDQQQQQDESEQEQRQQQQDGEMSPEQAARMLDALAEQEKENLKEAAARAQRGRRGTEKDW